jgi:hypothetical protein
MAQGRNSRSAAEVRQEIELQRAELADAVDNLRQAADVTSKLRAKLPLVAAGALGAGFFLAGGVGATMRLLARRSREGRERARLGRLSLVDRD